MAKKGVKLKEKATRRTMVPPVNVIKLMDILGGVPTSHAVSASTTLLYKAKKEGAINQVYELAAAHALENLSKQARPVQQGNTSPAFGSPRGGEVMFMVTLPADKADMFHRMVSAMGGVAMSA